MSSLELHLEPDSSFILLKAAFDSFKIDAAEYV
jgi:hypothetical protein